LDKLDTLSSASEVTT